MVVKDWKKDVFTIPNLLSLFRLLLIPVYVKIYLEAKTTADYILAGGLIVISCLTDLIDGKIARRFNMISTLGKLLDPVADKATQISLIACLMVRYPTLRYLVIPFVVKELFQLIACLINYGRGRVLKGALLIGKICTTVLFVTLVGMMFIPEVPPLAVTIITIIDGLFILTSFGEYLITFVKGGENFQQADIIK